MDKFLSLLIIWLQLDWVSSKQEVNQSPGALTVREGESLFLNCSYTDSAIYFLQWFRQDPGKGLTPLLLIQANQREETSGRMKVSLDKTSRHSVFYIATSQLGDLTTYLCASISSGSGWQLTFGSGTQLTVVPDIKNPDPAVYQLRSPKYSNTSVCLFTDFDSKINVSQEPSSTVFSSNSMALDMRAVGPKSNGALRWSASTDFLCENAFKETFYSSSGIPCDATLIEKSFETDMSLNIQNLSVIGLRILLLKVAGFNLLMTLRLWSS